MSIIAAIACKALVPNVAGRERKWGGEEETCNTAAQSDLEAQVIELVRANRSGAELRALLGGVDASLRRQLANGVAEQRSVLFLACYNHAPDLVTALVDAGADVAVGRLDEGTTPLHLSAGWLHDEEIVSILLGASRARSRLMTSLRSKPATGGLRDHTPLFWAMHYGHLKTAKYLTAFSESEGWYYLALDDDFEVSPHRKAEAATARWVSGQTERINSRKELRRPRSP